MRSLIAGSGRYGVPTIIKPYPESWATLDGLIVPVRQSQLYMGDLDYNQFQPNNETNNTKGALQRNNVARRDLAVSHEEAQRRHYLSEYTDDEKRWLVRTEEEERVKGRGFMERLKRRWDEQYPDKCKVSKQNLRNNAVRFRREIGNATEAIQDSTYKSKNESAGNTVCMDQRDECYFLRIEEQERNKGRGFMKRMKEEWDLIYEDKPMSAQCLRDNTAKFRKDKALLNLIEVRDARDLGPDQVQQNGRCNENPQGEGLDVENEDEYVNIVAEENMNNGTGDHRNTQEDDEGKREREREEENEDMREIRIRFMENLYELDPTTNQHIEERDRLIKLKVNIREEELENANKVLGNHLGNTDDICKIVDQQCMQWVGRLRREWE